MFKYKKAQTNLPFVILIIQLIKLRFEQYFSFIRIRKFVLFDKTKVGL